MATDAVPVLLALMLTFLFLAFAAAGIAAGWLLNEYFQRRAARVHAWLAEKGRRNGE